MSFKAPRANFPRRTLSVDWNEDRRKIDSQTRTSNAPKANNEPTHDGSEHREVVLNDVDDRELLNVAGEEFREGSARFCPLLRGKRVDVMIEDCERENERSSAPTSTLERETTRRRQQRAKRTDWPARRYPECNDRSAWTYRFLGEDWIR